MGGRDREDALSEIIGFVLILALIVVASTLYLMYVVPAEGREDEIEHMNQVKDRFVSYKTSVDGLWLRSLDGQGTRGVSLSTSFDLGTGGGNTQSSGLFLSFMRPIGTAARMSIAGKSGDRLTLITDRVIQLDQVDLGALNYTTENYYWIQQVYSYEMGGVFLEQPGQGVSQKVAPSLSVYAAKNSTDTTRTVVKTNLCLLNPTTYKDEYDMIGGTGPLRVETRLRENVNDTVRNFPYHNLTIRIDARNENWARAWRQVFVDAAQRSTLADPDDATEDANPIESGGPWFYIPQVTGTTAEMQIRNQAWERNPDPASGPHVYLDQTRADLQVTFQYAELG